MELASTKSVFLAIITAMLYCTASGYKPVVFMHGLFNGKSEATQILSWINQSHPGTRLYAVDLYDNKSSFHPLLEQVTIIGQKLEQISKNETNGFHLIGYSQGGLISRGILQTFPHNVDTFISLSAPLAGVFGRSFLKKYLPRFTTRFFYLFAYSQLGQMVSVCNFWNDPHHQDLYRKYSEFLAVYNNDTFNPKSHEFKANFLRLKKLVMIGGPDDEIIAPWQSSQFGFYDGNVTVIEMQKQAFYKEDWFGLKTLDERGDLHTHTMAGIIHHCWHTNYTVFKNFILPYLT